MDVAAAVSFTADNSVLVSNWTENLPPGSAGVPVLGYLPFMDSESHLTLQKLGRKYGNVFHLYFGSRLVVVLNDYTAIYEAFVKNAEIFAGRPPDVLFKERSQDDLGIIANDGEYWKQLRRFTMTNLRDYGVGKLALEPLILNEIQHFIGEIKKKNGKSFSSKETVLISVMNNILVLATGKRYEYGDPAMQRQIDLFARMEKDLVQLYLIMFFPWIVYIPGSSWLTQRKQIRKFIQDYIKINEEVVCEVLKDYKDGQRDNYVHAFTTERNARLRVNEKENIFTELSLVHSTKDLIGAGTESTTSTLQWALLYMTKHPQIQRKIQTEIDQVIGREREPSYNDRTNMPYTEATIMELHRVISLTPLSLAHRTTKDVVVLGHRIPKDTMIIPNLWAVHHDPKIWGDPENFRPERFIGLDGQVIKSEHLIPFSIGKRACVGEPLARMELFLYFVSLLQHFNFVPPDGVMPTFQSFPGFVRKPRFRLVCAKLREY